MHPMLATPSPAQVSRRTTSGLQIGWARAAANRAGTQATSSVDSSPGDVGTGLAAANQTAPQQPIAPQLSEQLDALADVLAYRRLAELERRGLFIRPEVF